MKRDETILKAVMESTHETVIDLVSAIGAENTAKLIETFSGCQLHVPLVETITKKQRNERIYADFSDGWTFEQLSVKYHLTENTIRKIINDTRKRGRKPC